jgi:O-antigen/teichoic acid export membrane protein
MNINRKDIIWAYAAQFFQIASGILVLPLILRKLNTNEIAMNYIMLNFGFLVDIFNFGFSDQFSRYFSYVFSGAQELKKEGVVITGENDTINFYLLQTLINTARVIYRVISLLGLLVMLIPGTLYINRVTQGFSLVSNSFVIWLVYSVSVFLNLYYTYLNSLLIGKGAIKESRKATVYSRMFYLCMAYFLLLFGFGLLAIVIANLLAPFLQRFLAMKYFYTEKIKNNLPKCKIPRHEIKKYFKILWYNAKKLGVITIGWFIVNRVGMVITPLFLSFEEVASYGLMIQIVNIIVTVSITMFTIYTPKFAEYRVTDKKEVLFQDFSLTMGFFYILFFIFAMALVVFGQHILLIIKSNAILPGTVVLVVYLIISLLEKNHSLFTSMIVTNNVVPFVKSSLFADVFIIGGTVIIMKYSNLGILGVILVPGIVQLCYANWKWPYVVCKEFGISFYNFLLLSFRLVIQYFIKILDGFISWCFPRSIPR